MSISTEATEKLDLKAKTPIKKKDIERSSSLRFKSEKLQDDNDFELEFGDEIKEESAQLEFSYKDQANEFNRGHTLTSQDQIIKVNDRTIEPMSPRMSITTEEQMFKFDDEYEPHARKTETALSKQDDEPRVLCISFGNDSFLIKDRNELRRKNTDLSSMKSMKFETSSSKENKQPAKDFTLASLLSEAHDSYCVPRSSGVRRNYKMGQVLGDGGFSKVRMAEYKKTGEAVAIKIIKKQKIKPVYLDMCY